MSNQKRTIIGSLDYAIATLQNLKKDLQDIGAPNSDLNWAIGGIVVTLVSYLIRTCSHVFEDTAKTGEPNAKHDIKNIQNKFNSFLDNMTDQD